MADTPRVTVPVEPTEAMLDAWHKAVEAGIFSQTPHSDYMRSAYRAMLSASPAPEGGAVLQAFADEVARIAITEDTSGDDAFNALNVVVDYARELSKARPDPDDTSGDLHGRLFRNPALATPAEAGEEASLIGDVGDGDCPTCQGSGLMRVVIGLNNPEGPVETHPCDRCPGLNGARVRLANMARDIDMGLTPLAAWPYQLAHPTSATAKATAHDIGLVLSALRAQPKAREDAQPVSKPAPFEQGGIGHAMYQAFHAYRADYVLSTDGADYEPTTFERDLIEDFFAGLMAEEAFFGPIRALYDTHPAPDALRVAVEALERIENPRSDFDLKNPRSVARQALAALQAAVKGGAA